MKYSTFCLVLAVAGLLACDRVPLDDGGRDDSYEGITLRLSGDTLAGVSGLTAGDLQKLRDANPDLDSWQGIMRVVVGTSDSTIPIVGAYSLSDDGVDFSPRFPFDPGRNYTLLFDATAPPLEREAIVTRLTFAPAERVLPASLTSISRILPEGDLWPENQLRIYIEFSAPMARTSGLDFVKLLDADGNEVVEAFLPLDVDFWNFDATRFTLFLDPGRVKEGILPNEQMGPPLVSGNEYTLVVDSAWRDAYGRPLASPMRKTFRAGMAQHEKIDTTRWSIRPPGRGTREALQLTFDRALDHGLLHRALGVENGRGAAVAGDVTIRDGEKSWDFVPRNAWAPGDYRIVVLAILEDGAGNRISRPFEVDIFNRVDSTAAPERYTLNFVVR